MPAWSGDTSSANTLSILVEVVERLRTASVSSLRVSLLNRTFLSETLIDQRFFSLFLSFRFAS